MLHTSRVAKYCPRVIPPYSWLQLIVVLDGTDVFRDSVKLPVYNAMLASNQEQYYLAGGAVSPHTRKKHLSLVSADNIALEWKLGSLSVLNGGFVRQCDTVYLCFICTNKTAYNTSF